MQMNEIYSPGCFQVFKQGGASTAFHAQWGAFGCKFLWLSNCVCVSVTLPKSASILHPLLFWFRSTFQSLLGLLGPLLCKQAMQDSSVIIVDSSACINFSLDWKTMGMPKALINSNSVSPAWTAVQGSSSPAPAQDPWESSFPVGFQGIINTWSCSQQLSDRLQINTTTPMSPSTKHQDYFVSRALSWT